ncbi:MAG: hydrogen gas-evolving membrane-bound hydrogenase subunit E [Patescibacteria group bacterium]|nr:hydrogen gas-evolving membrane-bound hydrogenase subunit E [Patescibacteria group bacterium]
MMKLLSILVIAPLAAALFLAFAALPTPAERKLFGDASSHIRAHAVHDTGAMNLVAAVLFDYRGFDTLGEITVVFSAVASVGLLFAGGKLPLASEGLSPIAKRSVASIVPFLFLVGFYIVVHGHLSPGGGFQGGVVWGSLLILLAIVYGSVFAERVVSARSRAVAESLGALAFLGLACLGLFTGDWFFTNLKAGYPRGVPGAIVSAGAIPFLSAAVGIKIGAGLAAIFYAMAKETAVPRQDTGADR